MKKEKVLIEYLYTKSKFVPFITYKMDGPVAGLTEVKGKPYGVVVAIGVSIMGWSLCNKTDKFDKVKALELAKARAKLISYVSTDDLEKLYQEEVPFSLSELVLKMNERSIKYFKD